MCEDVDEMFLRLPLLVSVNISVFFFNYNRFDLGVPIIQPTVIEYQNNICRSSSTKILGPKAERNH